MSALPAPPLPPSPPVRPQGARAATAVLQPQAAPHGLAQTIPLFSIQDGVFREKRLMIRTSAPFASWILQRQLTEMKEAAVTAMRHVGELADLVRFLPGFFGSITSHVKKRTSRAPEMGHFAAYKPHCGVFVVLVGCIKLLTTAALTENGRARRGFGLFAWF